MSKDRRRLLKVLGGALGTGAAAAVAGPIIQAVLHPAGRASVTGTGTFVPIAALDQLPEDGTPVCFPVVAKAPRDGWNQMPETTIGAVWLDRDGSAVRALSTICPHLGCRIDWQGGTKRFVCACHDSYFSVDGAVLSGPSPRGMDPLETRVVDGLIEVKLEVFAMGTAARVKV